MDIDIYLIINKVIIRRLHSLESLKMIAKSTNPRVSGG